MIYFHYDPDVVCRRMYIILKANFVNGTDRQRRLIPTHLSDMSFDNRNSNKTIET